MSQNTLYPAHGETREYLYNRIGFWLNGQYLEDDIPPAMTVMDYLHQVANLWGTKCSCNEGDCGACTVPSPIQGGQLPSMKRLIPVLQADKLVKA
jgi:xanthine dehydrogenase iron-sulfur cluster and FAD-binding subunit A